MRSNFLGWSLVVGLAALPLPSLGQDEGSPDDPGEAVAGEGAGDQPMPAEGEGEEGQPQLPPLDWQMGPSTATLGSIAEVQVPEGYRFANGDDTRKLMQMMGNPVDGTELGFIAPENLKWFIVFEFDDIGYVPDKDKDELKPDEILASIKEGNEAANEERRKNSWSEVQIIGWEQPPHYDPATKNLEWAIRGTSEGQLVTNYNTRILGRKGVMKANLVIDPESLAGTLPLFKGVLEGYKFKEGNKYAEFVEGDKIAEYGLVGLVAGGAAAVAAKTGILAKLGKGFWKLLVIAAAGLAALFRKIFGSKRVQDPNPPTTDA